MSEVMTKSRCCWKEATDSSYYVERETSEVKATLERGTLLESQLHVWTWVERKRSYIGRDAAIKAVERYV